MAVDATDLGALEKALNDAAGKASVLWQRCFLLIDLAVIWSFWDRVRIEDAPILGRVLSSFWWPIGLALTVCVTVFSIGIVTFPGEWADEHRPAHRVAPNIM